MYLNVAKHILITGPDRPEVAGLLRKHPRTIQNWCKHGELRGAYKAGRRWRIPPATLRKAGLGQALKQDDVSAEFAAAQALIDTLTAELEQAAQTKGPPRITRNWRRIAHKATKLVTSATDASRPSKKAPRPLQRPPALIARAHRRVAKLAKRPRSQHDRTEPTVAFGKPCTRP